MSKHCVNWKKVFCKTVSGSDYSCGFPDIIDRGYRGSMLTRVFQMEKQKKKPISFGDAIRLAHEGFFSSKIGHARGESHWYIDNFVEWISELGFHIELTGDEFDAYVLAQFAA